MSNSGSSHTPFNVVIAGGGVAALEAALALRHYGNGHITTSVIAPDREFVYRPMTVREPFAYAAAARYPLEEIARDVGMNLVADTVKSVDPQSRVVHTDAGEQVTYDALLLALGARIKPRFKEALTIDDRQLDELLHGLVQDVEGGYVRQLAFIVPERMGWPLPIYEIALMTACRAYDMNVELSITIATPEDAPLAIFGLAVSNAVSQLLEQNGIHTITSAHCEIPAPGRIAIHPGSQVLHADQIVALPELYGPSLPGLPVAAHGFIPVDDRCQVRGVERVYAAGDTTDFAIKHGGIAAQQADVAAQAIAALAGVADAPRPFHPVIHGILLTGGAPRYLSAHVTGGHGSSSQLTEAPTWSPPTKIDANYLAPYLDKRHRLPESVT
jgi:sulfide:quinone oxidoreductase